jgi:hypothetical protein
MKPKLLEATDKWAEAHFDEIVNFLWMNRKTIVKKEDDVFDSPDYGGLPKALASKLSSDFVDAIQIAFEELAENPEMTLAQFARHCGRYLYAE